MTATITQPTPHPGPAASDSTDALARLACAGQREAFDTLATRLRPRLVALLRQKLRCEADAEDTAQRALLRWWEKRDAYDPRRPFMPWLMTLALRLATDAQRAGARRANHEANAALPPDAPHAQPTAVERLETTEQRQGVWATVRETVGPEAAAVLWLFYGEGLTPKEIAPVVGKRAGAVRVMLHRGRAALRPHLAQWSPVSNPPPTGSNQTGDTHNLQAVSPEAPRGNAVPLRFSPSTAGVES